jgi:hypothetical protein
MWFLLKSSFESNSSNDIERSVTIKNMKYVLYTLDMPRMSVYGPIWMNDRGRMFGSNQLLNIHKYSTNVYNYYCNRLNKMVDMPVIGNYTCVSYTNGSSSTISILNGQLPCASYTISHNSDKLKIWTLDCPIFCIPYHKYFTIGCNCPDLLRKILQENCVSRMLAFTSMDYMDDMSIINMYGNDIWNLLMQWIIIIIMFGV